MRGTVTTETLPQTVLVVDDEAGVRELLTRLLEKKGLTVRTAPDGESALALLARERFGCLITDKNLPGVSGVELIRKVRAQQPFCACLLMTAYASMESVLEALRLGASDYLEKPLPDLQLVVQKISRAMETQRTAWERNALFEAVRNLKQTLARKDEQVFQQRTEREMLEVVLDLKIDEAVQPVRAQVSELQRLLAENEAQRKAFAAALHALLKDVRDAEGAAEVVAGKAALQKVGDQVQSVLAMLGGPAV